MSFAAITLCVASQPVFIFVVYFVIDSVRKLLDTPSYILNYHSYKIIILRVANFIPFRFLIATKICVLNNTITFAQMFTRHDNYVQFCSRYSPIAYWPEKTEDF
jgi:hypothetical protein